MTASESDNPQKNTARLGLRTGLNVLRLLREIEREELEVLPPDYRPPPGKWLTIELIRGRCVLKIPPVAKTYFIEWQKYFVRATSRTSRENSTSPFAGFVQWLRRLPLPKNATRSATARTRNRNFEIAIPPPTAITSKTSRSNHNI